MIKFLDFLLGVMAIGIIVLGIGAFVQGGEPSHKATKQSEQFVITWTINPANPASPLHIH